MSKNEILKQLEVKNHCTEDWNEMTGNAEVRFCSHCSLHVNNLSAMTRKQALKLVRKSDGRLCVRYVQNPIDKTPVFAERFHQISRRAKIAAGILGASLSLSALTYAQGEPSLKRTNEDVKVSQPEKTDENKTENPAASISGTICDSSAAVIPGIVVSLASADNSFRATAVSNEDGFYEFKNVPAGKFNLNAEGVNGFSSFTAENISVGQNTEVKQNIQMEVGMVMGGLAINQSYNALSQAVADDDLELVIELIAKGADVNEKEGNSSNITPIFLAVGNGNLMIIETLLYFGAKVNVRDEERQTPLMNLDEDANAELVRLLVKHGAKVNSIDEEGNTALIHTVEYAKPEVLQELISNGARINVRNKEGETALTLAAYEDDLEKVRILLLAGADVDLKNEDGESAWDQTDSDEVKQLLESYGATAKSER
jgi:ankyrin repeat protein